MKISDRLSALFRYLRAQARLVLSNTHIAYHVLKGTFIIDFFHLPLT